MTVKLELLNEKIISFNTSLTKEQIERILNTGSGLMVRGSFISNSIIRNILYKDDSDGTTVD